MGWGEIYALTRREIEFPIRLLRISEAEHCVVFGDLSANYDQLPIPASGSRSTIRLKILDLVIELFCTNKEKQEF